MLVPCDSLPTKLRPAPALVCRLTTRAKLRSASAHDFVNVPNPTCSARSYTKIFELDLDATDSITVEAARNGFSGVVLQISEGITSLKPGVDGTDRVADADNGVDERVDTSTAMTNGGDHDVKAALAILMP